jgi:hypothetical protein
MIRWLLAVVLLAACQHQPTFPELVTAANNRWYAAICRWPRYDDIQYVPSIPVCGVPGSAWWGCYDNGLVRISQVVPATDLLQVITHEMGHSISPNKHAKDNTGVMSAYVRQATHNITAADIALLCEEYECPCKNPEAP